MGNFEFVDAVLCQELNDRASFPMLEVAKAVIVRINHNGQDCRLSRYNQRNIRSRTYDTAKKFWLNERHRAACPKIAASGCHPRPIAFRRLVQKPTTSLGEFVTKSTPVNALMPSTSPLIAPPRAITGTGFALVLIS